MTTLTPEQRETIRKLATEEATRYAAKVESGKTLTSNDEKRFDFADFSLRLLNQIRAQDEKLRRVAELRDHCGGMTHKVTGNVLGSGYQWFADELDAILNGDQP